MLFWTNHSSLSGTHHLDRMSSCRLLQGAVYFRLASTSHLKGLRAFLGLAGYYSKFVHHFDLLAHPLTELLKKDNFQWSLTATHAFSTLKCAMSSASVLALLDVTRPTSALVVLSQNQHPIAFLNKPLAEKHKALSVYDKKMMVIMFAVQKWGPYLLGHPFKILTDHQILKYFFNQRITTPTQQKWLLKLLGYNYTLASYRNSIFLPLRDTRGSSVLTNAFVVISISLV